MKVCPAIVTVPVLTVVSGFAEMETFMVPLPVPAGDPSPIQLELEVAVQAHVLPVVTATVTDSPEKIAVFAAGEIE